MTTHGIPFVRYDSEGNRRVVGTGSIDADGSVVATITDPELIAKLQGDGRHGQGLYSIVHNEMILRAEPVLPRNQHDRLHITGHIPKLYPLPESNSEEFGPTNEEDHADRKTRNVFKNQ